LHCRHLLAAESRGRCCAEIFGRQPVLGPVRFVLDTTSVLYRLLSTNHEQFIDIMSVLDRSRRHSSVPAAPDSLEHVHLGCASNNDRLEQATLRQLPADPIPGPSEPRCMSSPFGRVQPATAAASSRALRQLPADLIPPGGNLTRAFGATLHVQPVQPGCNPQRGCLEQGATAAPC